MTYATAHALYLRGRVLVNRNIEVSGRDSLWKNLTNTYKRLNSYEVAGAKIGLSFNETQTEFYSDEDGYFELPVTLNRSLPKEELWHHPLLELLEAPVPFTPPVQTRAQVMIPPATARFGIISDIDDTVLNSQLNSLVKTVYMTFMRNAYTRLPFKGVAAFYDALQKGLGGAEDNPLFYVSSSPWNLYDLLVDFMEINKIPRGPIFLKDYGFTHKKLFSESHHVHKPRQIRNILNTYPYLPFILIGDSGQHDPEIYAAIIKEFPGRILACYIRDVTQQDRAFSIQKITEELKNHKVEMVLASDSYAAARHAADRGFIGTSSLENIRAETEFTAPDPVEREIDQEIGRIQ